MSSAAVPEFGPNDWFVEEKYQQFLADPQSVDLIWREFFADTGSGSKPRSGGHAGNGGTSSTTTVTHRLVQRRCFGNCSFGNCSR